MNKENVCKLNTISFDDVELIKIFSCNIKYYRTKAKLSQERLADMCNLHPTYISQIECCKINASIKTIQLISSVLEVEPYKLFEQKRGVDYE